MEKFSIHERYKNLQNGAIKWRVKPFLQKNKEFVFMQHLKLISNNTSAVSDLVTLPIINPNTMRLLNIMIKPFSTTKTASKYISTKEYPTKL